MGLVAVTYVWIGSWSSRCCWWNCCTICSGAAAAVVAIVAAAFDVVTLIVVCVWVVNVLVAIPYLVSKYLVWSLRHSHHFS